MLDGDFESLVLLGPGFLLPRRIEWHSSKARHKFHLLSGVKNIPDLMSQADIALGSFGVTAYELAAMGVPGIFTCADAGSCRICVGLRGVWDGNALDCMIMSLQRC